MQLPLKIHGGKAGFNGKLAKWIISLFPEHTHFVDVFFGGGSVTLFKPQNLIQNHSEVANDINKALTNFWKVLQDNTKFNELRLLCEKTPFSQIEWQEAEDYRPKEIPDVLAAWKFFIRCRQSRSGQMKDFATLSKSRTRRGMNEQASSWLSAIECLDEIHARLSRVVITNEDFEDCILKNDAPNTLYYSDPPYLSYTRTAQNVYEFEMSFEDHVRLLRTLTRIKGKFLLSGYNSELYNIVAQENRWKKYEFEIVNNASADKEKRIMTECLWCNF